MIHNDCIIGKRTTPLVATDKRATVVLIDIVTHFKSDLGCDVSQTHGIAITAQKTTHHVAMIIPGYWSIINVIFETFGAMEVEYVFFNGILFQCIIK